MVDVYCFFCWFKLNIIRIIRNGIFNSVKRVFGWKRVVQWLEIDIDDVRFATTTRFREGRNAHGNQVALTIHKPNANQLRTYANSLCSNCRKKSLWCIFILTLSSLFHCVASHLTSASIGLSSYLSNALFMFLTLTRTVAWLSPPPVTTRLSVCPRDCSR